MKPNQTHLLVGACVLVFLVAAGLYADMVYKAPEAPPKVIYTIKGPVVLHETAQAGDLVTAPNLGTIYYLNNDLKRVVFPDEQTFLSWYPDYSAVKTIPQDVLESFPLSGRNATIRPGTYLVKIQSSPQVWMIGFPSTLFWLSGGESQVQTLFGADWSSRVVDVPEYFISNYGEGIEISDTDTYPAGLIVHIKSNDQYYLVTPEGQRLINEAGMTANHFNKRFVIEREETLNRSLVGPTVETYEPRWGSPDPAEQAADRGPQDVDTQGRETEAS